MEESARPPSWGYLLKFVADIATNMDMSLAKNQSTTVTEMRAYEDQVKKILEWMESDGNPRIVKSVDPMLPFVVTAREMHLSLLTDRAKCVADGGSTAHVDRLIKLCECSHDPGKLIRRNHERMLRPYLYPD